MALDLLLGGELAPHFKIIRNQGVAVDQLEPLEPRSATDQRSNLAVDQLANRLLFQQILGLHVRHVILVGVGGDRVHRGTDQRRQVLLILTDHNGPFDVLTLLQLLLDRQRLDVLTAQQHDCVLGPAGYLEFATMGQHAQVPGVEPAVSVEHRRGHLRALIVPLHHLRTADVDHPHLSAGQFPAVLVADTALSAVQHLTDRAGNRPPLVPDGQDGRSFGEAVALQQ